MFQSFKNRREAGIELSNALAGHAGEPDTIVMALPRGGVPVAFETARALSLPLDVWLVRKLGAPGHEELAVGALAMGNIRYINEDIMRALHIPQEMLDQVVARESEELSRRNRLYRRGRPVPPLRDKTVIIVDDGLATGATMRAAIESLRQAGAERIIVAVPVGSAATCRELEEVADEVICLSRPEPFYSVGQWYRDFAQTSDAEVQDLLARQPYHRRDGRFYGSATAG